jgi:hypothetical protein
MDSGSLTLGDSSTGAAAYIGFGAGYTGTFTLNDGIITALPHEQIEVGSWAGPGYFYQKGGTVTHLNDIGLGAFYVGAYASGRYELQLGTLISPQTSVGYGGHYNPAAMAPGIGVFVQTGGSHQTPQLIIGEGWDDGGNGTYTISNGTLTADEIYLAKMDDVRSASTPLVGTFNQSGGSTVTVNSLLLIGSDVTFDGPTGGAGVGTYNFTGGTLTDGANNANLTVRYDAPAKGTFQGRGTVGLSGALANNGRVIADGGTLNMSSFGSVTSTIENTTTNGWFAINGGKLELPPIPISGNGSYNWGENPSDAQLDLVNSVRVTLAGVSGSGSLDIDLLHPANPAAPLVSMSGEVVGLWDFTPSGFTFTTADLTFRYDDVLASNENLLRLYHYTGGNWVQLAATCDTANNLITATGVTSLSPFVIVVIPEPVTALLVLLPTLALLRRRK